MNRTFNPTWRGFFHRKSFLLDLGISTLLVFCCLLFFRSVLIGNTYMFPWDFVDFMYPAQRFVGDAIRAGELPLWDPFVLLGYPIIGDLQASVFNPIYLLYHLLTVLPPLGLKTFELLEILQIACAGVFTYFLARTTGVHRWGSFFAGLVYMLGGFFPVHVEHETWIAASAWIPLLLLLAMHLFAKPRFAWALAIGVVLAFSLFAGYPQTTLLSIYFLIAFLFWHSTAPLRQRRFFAVFKNAAWLFVSLLFGVAIAAIQLLPSAELAVFSTRGAASFAGTTTGVLQSGALVTLLFPKLLGSDGSIPFLSGEVTHSQKYIGVIPLVFVFVGVFYALRRVYLANFRYAGFFTALTLVAFVGSFGPDLMVYRAFELLPFMTLFQRAATLFPFALLGAAVMGGGVCDVLAQFSASEQAHRQDSAIRQGLAIAMVLCAALALVYLAGRFSPQTVQALWFAFRNNTLMLRLADTSFTPFFQQVAGEMTPFALVPTGLLVLGWLLPKFRPQVVVGLIVLTFLDLNTFNAEQIFNRYPRSDFDRVSGLQELLPTLRGDGWGAFRVGMNEYSNLENAGNILGIEEMNGYNPLRLRRVEEVFRAIPSINTRVFDLLNVKFLVVSDINTPKPGPPQTFEQVLGGKVYVPVGPLDPDKFFLRSSTLNDWYHLVENLNALPRFFAVNQVRVLSDPRQRLMALSAADFEPHQQIILEEPFADALSGWLDTPVRIDDYRRNSFRLSTRIAGGKTLLFIGVPSYPGWSAVVDGLPAKIFIADHAFMAIPLESGEHSIRFAFDPITFKLGATITGWALVLGVFLGVRECWLHCRASAPIN